MSARCRIPMARPRRFWWEEELPPAMATERAHRPGTRASNRDYLVKPAIQPGTDPVASSCPSPT